MKTLQSCEFNMDTNRVELLYTDGTMIAIDTVAAENEYAEDMVQRSELDWLIYNAPLDYARLVLEGDVEKYLREVTEYDGKGSLCHGWSALPVYYFHLLCGSKEQAAVQEGA